MGESGFAESVDEMLPLHGVFQGNDPLDMIQ